MATAVDAGPTTGNETTATTTPTFANTIEWRSRFPWNVAFRRARMVRDVGGRQRRNAMARA
ncbi:hypothetical protein P3T76_007856 [Phytophthora citrophthora]|uniref:Uncharacterized protein n=1 Tax=Phytophthora citrophthora TaxID=4793 RepID=A0AAD9GL20_9STRA|nr:hypothetical protein P3T76_007856 [Phytophthora citrophthora]